MPGDDTPEVEGMSSNHPTISPPSSRGPSSSDLVDPASLLNDKNDSLSASSRRGIGRKDGSVRRRDRYGGFLLNSLTRSSRNSSLAKKLGSAKGKEKESDGDDGSSGSSGSSGIVASSHASTPQRRSLHEYAPSIGSSPLASQVTSVDGDALLNGKSAEATLPAASPSRPRSYASRTDPATLVNLALQLSQSRTRAASARFNPHLAGAGVSGRVVSAGSQAITLQAGLGPKLALPLPDADTNAQVPVEETEINPGVIVTNGLATQSVEITDPGLASSHEIPGATQFLPSHQTLIRAERARISLELRYHHRRLLQYLPRMSTNKSGTERNESEPFAGITRDNISKKGLHLPNLFGQQYNPLQYVRNRKIRRRKDRALDAEAQGWKDVERVKAWIEDVAASGVQSTVPEYGRVSLPYFESAELQALIPARDDAKWDDGTQLKARPTLPPNDWTTTPWDMLADAYWVQEDNNRGLIEDSMGNKVYPELATFQDSIRYEHERRGSKLDKSSRLHSNSIGNPDLAPLNGYHPSTSVHASRVAPGAETNNHRRWSRAQLEEGHHRRRSKMERFSKRLSRNQPSLSLSSSSEKSDYEGKQNRWSETFQENWQGNSIPDGASNYQNENGDSRAKGKFFPHHENLAGQVYWNPGRERPQSYASSRAGLDRHGSRAESIQSRPGTISDFDSTAPNSPINAGFRSGSASEFDPKRLFRSPEKRGRFSTVAAASSAPTADTANRVQRKDFAGDPFKDEVPTQKQNTSLRHRTRTLSSPSETSFSAGSEEHGGTSFQRKEADRSAFISDKELGFNPLKPWKGTGAIVDRAKGLLRRKDLGFDSSDTEEEGKRKHTRSALSRTATSSTADRNASTNNNSRESVGSIPQYQGPQLPAFRPTRKNDSPSRNLQRPSLAAFHRKSYSTGQAELGYSTPGSRGDTSPAAIISPAPSQRAPSQKDSELRLTSGDDDSSSRSRQPIQRRITNERRGATVMDNAGNQWPIRHRTDAPPWPGQQPSAGDAPKIVWTGPELQPVKPGVITIRDVARVEVVFSSLVRKADFIIERYQSVPSEPTPLLRKIRAFNADQKPVTRLQEPEILAGHLLSRIDADRTALHAAIDEFSSVTVPKLESEYCELKDHIERKLTAKVLDASDEADALSGRIAQDFTLEIKELNDRIDMIWRNRRTRSRWLRRVAFTLLEWSVLAIMWALWFIVICFKLTRGILKVSVSVTRWLLWL